MENFSRLDYLFRKYTSGNCTPDERNEFFEMVVDDAYAATLNDLIKDYIDSSVATIEVTKERSAKMFESIDNATSDNEKVIPVNSAAKRFMKWPAAAAVILFFIMLHQKKL